MNINQKEELIESWSYPWAELLRVFQASRDERLSATENDAERGRIFNDYEHRLDELFSVRR